jgi:hypothetical protein
LGSIGFQEVDELQPEGVAFFGNIGAEELLVDELAIDGEQL